MPGSGEIKAASILEQFGIDVSLPFRIVQAPLRRSGKYERDGHWNEKERLKYSVFITFFRRLFEEPQLKKGVRVYEMMSDMIVTRNPNQCRSHHQKMEKYRVTIDEIVASVSEKYEPSLYKQLESRYLALLKTLLDNPDKYLRTWNTDKNKAASRRSLPNDPEDNTERVLLTSNLPDADQTFKSDKIHSSRQKEDPHKPLKRTAEDYEDAEPEEQPDDQEIPRLYSEEYDQLKQEEEEGGYEEPLQRESPAASQERVQAMEDGEEQVGRMRIGYYQEQIKKMAMKRQWHYDNAQQLYNQWSTEMEAVRLCDQTMKRYALAGQNHVPN